MPFSLQMKINLIFTSKNKYSKPKSQINSPVKILLHNYRFSWILVTLISFVCLSSKAQIAKIPMVPPQQELNRSFGKHDEAAFLSPSRIYRPGTHFFFIGGNVSKEGITKDLEAIAKAGLSSVSLFHGQSGPAWPGVQPQITCLSPSWDDAIKYTALECKRLGLELIMNNTPGWATSGGPWIKPSNAMRDLTWSHTSVEGGQIVSQYLPLPEPNKEEWRDYKDVTVLAFPTPDGDIGKPLEPQTIKSNTKFDWQPYLTGPAKRAIHLPPAPVNDPHWIEVEFANEVFVRSIEFSSVQRFNHAQSYEPGVKVYIQAVLPDGKLKDILNVDMPQSNFQDNQPITLACSEVPGVKKYRISIQNKYDMAVSSLRLFSAAKKNNWESEAGWTLRSILRVGQDPQQSTASFIDPDKILDISSMMDKSGKLTWNAPKGTWTVLRFGNINAGKRNTPAPVEATGWEANKLATSGADAHFAGYIGRLAQKNGPLSGGLLKGMLIDSWECNTQTWTDGMEQEFKLRTNYPLRAWLPALTGYVIKDHETTTRFLTDWRRTISDLFTNNFYGRMAKLAHDSGLNFTNETAAGDVMTGDILEYFKFADVPRCEFWQPMTDGFVGSLNFKPIKPTVSAARIYGKPRVAAEAFTSFDLTWNEHFEMLREVANVNAAEGVTHFVLHTYTHNPQIPFLPPGTSFGTNIGTPFIRGQTWWQYMPDFNKYLSRCTYMLERGKPVSDVLWYLGDEIDHKPDQKAGFPEGFKYDYCNPDVLLNRLKVVNGKLVTPEGISYRLLWLPDAPRMLPKTLEKIYSLVQEGATILGKAPVGLATLSDGKAAKLRFDTMVKNIWGDQVSGIKKVGKGRVISGIALNEALSALQIKPDVTGGDALWLHRQTDGADWYFVSAPKGKAFSGELSFRTNGSVELWDPNTGELKPVVSYKNGDRTVVKLNLERSNSCFLVFKHTKATNAYAKEPKLISTISLPPSWKVTFPAGWGIPEPVQVNELKPWKDLNLTPEGKAFSGTAIYSTTFVVDKINTDVQYILDLGKVDMAASVIVNNKEVGKLLAPPYKIDLKNLIRQGQNILTINVTSTWFNRLVFDAGQPEQKRKTWVIAGPTKSESLQMSGLMGPVVIQEFSN
jgi:hypothetical protein